MSTLMDDRCGLKKESVFKTPVTPDRFMPFVDGTNGTWDPRIRQSMGMQGGSGRRAPLGSRNYPTIGQGVITLQYELESKQGGVLLDAVCGVSTVTAITGGSQMNFHDGVTGTTMSSYTIQIVKVQNGGTETVETYSGCTCTKFTLEQPEDDIAVVTATFDAATYTTATAAATQTYATAPTIFDHWQGSVGLGGTLTVPTTTALATGLTPFTSFRSWKFDVDQAADIDRRIIGSRNIPTIGVPKIQFSGKAEFNENTLNTALVAGTKLPFYHTWTTPEVLGAGFAQGQLVIPQIVLSKDLPKVKPGETRFLDVQGDVTSDGTNRDFYICYRSADTVL